MDDKKRRELIDKYKAGYRLVAEIVARASDQELDRHPAPGKWSAREIVHHLADSEMTAAIRLRLLIAADRPAIVGYDQEEFARRPRPAGAESAESAQPADKTVCEDRRGPIWKTVIQDSESRRALPLRGMENAGMEECSR